MKKKFFTNASPKAVEGIRRAYSGSKVSAVLDPKTGLATVVVKIADDHREMDPAEIIEREI